MRRPWKILFAAALVLSLFADLRLVGDHTWGFFALFGVVGCIVIILISKWLGSLWLQRDEAYYERGETDE